VLGSSWKKSGKGYEKIREGCGSDGRLWRRRMWMTMGVWVMMGDLWGSNIGI
jgi:hypothetical protein